MNLFSGKKINPICLNIIQIISIALIVVCLLAYPVSAFGKDDPTAEEKKIGKEEADKFAADKSTKFIEDPVIVQRIVKIGDALAKVANEKEIYASYGKKNVYKFDYTFKIVEDKDINAFSLPGGFVYINKGLLDYAQSDDELAGVIAHEIGHIAHHHAMQLVNTQQKQMLGVAGLILAGALGGVKGDELGNLAYMGQLITVAKLSAYGQKAEFDADRTSVAYMAEANYNPVGMLTFMERLARDEARKPKAEFGIFRTHPESRLRAKEIIDEIDKLGISINRRLVTQFMTVQVKTVDGMPASSVSIAGVEIVRMAESGGLPASVRAEKLAENLHSMLLAGLKYRDVKLSDDGNAVVIMNKTIIAPTLEDAALYGSSINSISESAINNMKRALIKEQLEHSY